MKKIITIILIILILSGCTMPKYNQTKEQQEEENLTYEERIAKNHYLMRGTILTVWRENMEGWSNKYHNREICIKLLSNKSYTFSYKVESKNNSYINFIYFNDDSDVEWVYEKLLEYINKEVRIYYWYTLGSHVPNFKAIFTEEIK